MKKVYIILIATLSLIISGCAAESHASENTVIDDFFAAYIEQDYQTASSYIADDSKESFISLQTLVADETLNTVVLRHMSTVSYKVISSTLNEDTGTVQLRLIYPNAGGAFMNAIGTMYVDASEGKLSNNAPEEVTSYINTLLESHLNAELEAMDREKEIQLVKENDQWRILMTEELKNALSANMMNAIAELELMGVQF